MKRILVTAVLSLLLLAHCGRQEAGITIEFWTLQLSPAFDGYFKGLISEYEAANPGIRVHWVDIPYDGSVPKLLSAIASGNPPDAVNLPAEFTGKFAAKGLFYDLRNSVPYDSLRARYVPGALDDCTAEGAVIAAPWYLNTYCCYQNSAMFREAGINPDTIPLTFSGIARFIRQYKEKTGKHAFYWNIGKESFLPMMLESEGESMLTADGRAAAFTSPRAIAMLQEWVTLYRQGYLPAGSVTATNASIVEPYHNGQVPMIFTGPVFLRRVRENAPGIYQSTRVTPPLTGATGKHELAVMCISVLQRSKHAREAAAFALFVTNARNQLAFARLAPVYPATTASLADSFFTVNDGSPIGIAKTMGARLTHEAVRLRKHLKHEEAPMLQELFDRAIQSACLDGVPVEDALQKAAAQWNTILARSRR